ncbi:MAG: glycosyltransferase family 2 protein [bacterium]
MVVVSIIIPVKNRLEFTRACLHSIQATKPQIPYEIIVVDNASDDGTGEFLHAQTESGNLIWIYNDPPRPFAASCNRGAARASGEFLLFINNDTVALPGWLEELCRPIEANARIGAVGAKLLYPDDTIQHAGVAFHYFKELKVCGPYHIFRTFPRYALAVSKEREFQAVTGACMLTSRAVFDELGGFDEQFINCFEDVDYCLRLRECGYKVVYTP